MSLINKVETKFFSIRLYNLSRELHNRIWLYKNFY